MKLLIFLLFLISCGGIEDPPFCEQPFECLMLEDDWRQVECEPVRRCGDLWVVECSCSVNQNICQTTWKTCEGSL